MAIEIAISLTLFPIFVRSPVDGGTHAFWFSDMKLVKPFVQLRSTFEAIYSLRFNTLRTE